MYQHGGDIYSNKNIEIDFSVSLNPLGMPEKVKKAIRSQVRDYETYPDYSCRELRKRLSIKECTDEDCIICANGAAELIFDVVRAEQPQKALILAPAFSEYAKALEAVGCQVDYFLLRKEDGYTLNPTGTFEELLMKLEEKYDMIFLCNPNNPAGTILKHDLMLEILRKCAVFETRVILDECFLDFTEERSFSDKIQQFENLFLLKAFTKIYSMAGIRLGYALCSDKKLLQKIYSIRQCWNVSAIAQKAGVAALEEEAYLQQTKEYVKKERIYLEKRLVKLGYNVVKSASNYILFRTEGIKDLQQALMHKGILIRKCDDYVGLEKGYYRIAVKRRLENRKLIQAMEEIQNGG